MTKAGLWAGCSSSTMGKSRAMPTVFHQAQIRHLADDLIGNQARRLISNTSFTSSPPSTKPDMLASCARPQPGGCVPVSPRVYGLQLRGGPVGAAVRRHVHADDGLPAPAVRIPCHLRQVTACERMTY